MGSGGRVPLVPLLSEARLANPSISGIFFRARSSTGETCSTQRLKLIVGQPRSPVDQVLDVATATLVWIHPSGTEKRPQNVRMGGLLLMARRLQRCQRLRW